MSFAPGLRGDVTLGKCGMPVLCLVCYHYLRKEIVGEADKENF